MQPAQLSGNAFQDRLGTFLISQTTPIGTDDYRLAVVRVESPLKDPTFSVQFIDALMINAGFTADVPQPGGGGTINVGDSSPTNAVWRARTLFTAATVGSTSASDAGQPTAHWFRIDTSDLDHLTLADQGDICGEDIAPMTATFHPVVSVSRDLFMAVGFS